MSDRKARREARIRKILENSESRLKKIVTSNDISEGEHQIECKAELVNNSNSLDLERDVSEQTGFPPNVTTIQNEILKNHIPFETNQTENQRRSSDLRTIYQNPVPDSDSVSELEFENFEEKTLILRNWVIIFLALVVRYIFLISEQYAQIVETDILINYNMNKIFIPFFIFEVTEFVFFRPFIPQSGVLNMLFMLNMSLHTEYIHKIITGFRVIVRVVRDLMVYFFTFVCFDQILNFVLGEEQTATVP
ncbi:hypothetical protein ILUMI_22827 [Ignelater luminosus]|uniref:Uncharacterized protein n=1 Tax=Ignelater luminosus TaxID=2038154 RepID=A0A8K0C9A1_IGNLU|nr:hypothetical protein ILUMI_22827 [Ignelater luminosus]